LNIIDILSASLLSEFEEKTFASKLELGSGSGLIQCEANTDLAKQGSFNRSNILGFYLKLEKMGERFLPQMECHV